MKVWAVEGRSRLVVNVHELGKHWEGSIVKKEGRRGGWIAWWVVGVEGIPHGCLPSRIRRCESKHVGIAELADNALEGPNARDMAMGSMGRGVEGWRRSGSSGRLGGWLDGLGQWCSLSSVATHSVR